MAILDSNADALLVAIPMIGLLIAGHFRLDELIGKPQKRMVRRRQVAGSDEQGRPLCLDPDGSIPVQGGGRRKPK
jgi:hypothetical protein